MGNKQWSEKWNFNSELQDLKEYTTKDLWEKANEKKLNVYSTIGTFERNIIPKNRKLLCRFEELYKEKRACIKINRKYYIGNTSFERLKFQYSNLVFLVSFREFQELVELTKNAILNFHKNLNLQKKQNGKNFNTQNTENTKDQYSEYTENIEYSQNTCTCLKDDELSD